MIIRISTLGVALFSMVSLQAAEFHVPGDFDTVQEAVNSASSGDKIWLGEYFDGASVNVATDGILFQAAPGVEQAGFERLFFDGAGGDVINLEIREIVQIGREGVVLTVQNVTGGSLRSSFADAVLVSDINDSNRYDLDVSDVGALLIESSILNMVSVSNVEEFSANFVEFDEGLTLDNVVGIIRDSVISGQSGSLVCSQNVGPFQPPCTAVRNPAGPGLSASDGSCLRIHDSTVIGGGLDIVLIFCSPCSLPQETGSCGIEATEGSMITLINSPVESGPQEPGDIPGEVFCVDAESQVIESLALEAFMVF